MTRAMRIFPPVAVAALLLGFGGCREVGPREEGSGARGSAAASPAGDRQAPRWDFQSSREGSALVLLAAGNAAAIRLYCPTSGGRLEVNVPAFRPIASEERLSLGSGVVVAALVADTRGDARRGGVSASGAVPSELLSLIAGPVSASYAAQTSGPHPAPPVMLASNFIAACRKGAARPAAAGTARPVSACLMQGAEQLTVTPLRAIGTEPFWGARIAGRCVIYSTPEDLAGTRIWTRYTPAADGGVWTGVLGGRRFELTTRAAPGCSDGMSDRRYPIAVTLLVGSERRTGCAEPL